LIHFFGGRLIGLIPAELTKLPPISILKPLKGMENGIRENLEGFFRLDYPQYEIFFSVADPNDPAAAVVRELIARYPDVNANLIVGDDDVGVNPKVNNLVRSYARARHDFVLISDASVNVDPGFLRRLIPHFDEGTGLVTAVGTGRRAKGVGGHLEATFLNTFYPRWMLIANYFQAPTVVGHTMLFRKSVAERFGGIRSLARYLAEDYMSGQAMRQLGLSVKILRDPVLRTVGHQSFKAFWDRHLRWGRMRKVHAPLILLFEVLCYPIPSGILGAIAARAVFGIAPLQFLALHLAFNCLNDIILMLRIRAEVNYLTPFWWLLRETLAVPHWLHMLSGNTVSWRGSLLKLQPGGTVMLATK
jgi:ceramide glucosyltransferase